MKAEELARISQAPTIQSIHLSFGLEIYVGPHFHEDGFDLGASVWTNPYSSEFFGVEGCLEEYERFIRSRDDLMALIPSLRGKELSCCCNHAYEQRFEMCHATVLRNLYLEYAAQMVEKHGKQFFVTA